MRLLRVEVILLAIVEIGCASNQTVPRPSQPHPQTVTADKACGNPTRFPVSKGCVNVIGSPYGSLLQQKSDLVMDVWRYCPSSNPCLRLDACRKLTGIDSGSPELNAQLTNCMRAQQNNYSCSSLQKDPEYVRQQQTTDECLKKMIDDRSCFPGQRHHPGSRAWKSEVAHQKACWDRCLPDESMVAVCTHAQAALADFENGLKNAIADAELKQLFKPSEGILVPTAAEPPNSIE